MPSGHPWPTIVTVKLICYPFVIPCWTKCIIGVEICQEISKDINSLWQQIDDLHDQGDLSASLEVTHNLETMILEQELYWHQRARTEWIQAGDRNTKFFHSKASAITSRNFIKAPQDNESTWHIHDDVLSTILLDYFTSLFTSARCNTHLLATLHFNQVSDTDYENLVAPISDWELYQAIHQLGKWKSLGPDELPYMVFHWKLVFS